MNEKQLAWVLPDGLPETPEEVEERTFNATCKSNAEIIYELAKDNPGQWIEYKNRVKKRSGGQHFYSEYYFLRLEASLELHSKEAEGEPQRWFCKYTPAGYKQGFFKRVLKSLADN